MKLLVATDGSPQAHMAVTEAARIATRPDDTVTLVLVSDYLEVGDGDTLATPSFPLGHTGRPTVYESPPQADAMGILHREATPLREQGIALELVHRRGDAAAQILEAAEAIGADMIVLGAHGHQGVMRFLLGSVADKVMRDAPCSVLLAKRRDARP